MTIHSKVKRFKFGGLAESGTQQDSASTFLSGLIIVGFAWQQVGRWQVFCRQGI